MPEVPEGLATPTTSLPQVITEAVGRRARRYVGLAVGVVVGGERATVGFGEHRRGGHRPHGRTSFQIGSVTKVFTSLLLADAVVRGEVELERPLDTIIPGTATHPEGRPITLVDLATHSSGLPRLPPGLWERGAWAHRHDPYAEFTTSQLIDALREPPPDPPGHRIRYSNFGAGVLGEALCRLLGSNFDELVAERITVPMGMEDTHAARPSSPHLAAEGHSRWRRPVVDWQLPALPGAGALRATVDDLLELLHAHLEPFGTPLQAAIQLAREPRHPGRGHLDMALGWHVLHRRDGTPWWWHNGGTGGFSTFVGFDPAAGTGVVVLANTARTVDPLGARLLQRFTRLANRTTRG